MSRTSVGTSSRSNYQTIFDNALETYKKKTGKDLTSDPLLRKLEACDSPDAILTMLRAQIFEPGQSQSSGDKLTKWMNPTVNVLNALSKTVGLAYPPAGVIFTGMGVLLSAAKGLTARRDALIDLFERIESVFERLETYIEVPPTAGMTNAIVKVMTEVLYILAVATEEIKQNSAKKFMKKLAGRTDLEDALQKFETVTLQEAQMAAAEALKAIHDVGDKVMGVDDKVDGVQDTLKAVEDRVRGVEGMLQGVGDMLQGVDVRVKGIGDKIINVIEETSRWTGNKTDAMTAEDLKALHGVDDKTMVNNDKMQATHDTLAGDLGVEKIGRPIVNDFGNSSGNKLRQDIVEWLSPPDPSVNYKIARDTRQKGTVVWFTESSTFKNWKASGSLLWIYGKPGSGKSVLISAIIQDIECISNTGSAYMTYFFFDFKDMGKQDSRAFLSSVLSNSAISLFLSATSFSSFTWHTNVAHNNPVTMHF
ncbi:hypothetical protein BJV74DRAFT_190418 [Russula compacta]|nr:hypothetical protein BJV74DRAFT_190418 [Russula compacta]